MLTDGLVGAAAMTPTLFKLADVRAYVSLGMVYRGADLLTTLSPGAITDLVGEVANGSTESAVEREAYNEIDQESVEALLSTFEREGIPTLQVVYFPGVDLFSHVAEGVLEQQKRNPARVSSLGLTMERCFESARRQTAICDSLAYSRLLQIILPTLTSWELSRADGLEE